MNRAQHSRRLRAALASVVFVFPLLSRAEPAEKPAEVKTDPTPVTKSASMITSFAPVVEKVTPSVVTVATSKNIANNRARGRRGMPFNSPDFRRFFGLPEPGENENEDAQEPAPAPDAPAGKSRTHKEATGLGSGVVVSPDGHILTNNHVIDGADEIIVSLSGDPKDYIAKKIGTDPNTDLAVLKIEAKDLHPITFADSDKVRVGDISIAVGNPFGLRQTVSMGIVSGLGRNDLHIIGMGGFEYEDFIQTDASINPGNSGGALVDIEGRLIGVNTAIYSRTGGNQGIGFAVPSNLAHSIMDSLLLHGRVVRGFLGIVFQDIDSALRDKFKIATAGGALVKEVVPDGPAEKGGIAIDDIITAIDGKPIESTQDLRMRVGNMSPGTKIAVKVLREGREQDIAVELAELGAKKPDVLDGLKVKNLSESLRQEHGIPDKANGVVVVEVAPDSPSALAGIEAGDVIHDIESKPVGSVNDAVEMSNRLIGKKEVQLRVSRKGVSRFVEVKEE